MSYVVRKLDFQFAIEKDSSQISVTGKRALVIIEHAQIPDAGPTAIARIYGMTLDHMNALSKAGLFWDARKNEMTISAGDDQEGMVTVFKGIIQEAYPDFRSIPQTNFYVKGQPMVLAQLKPVAPTTYPGGVDLVTAVKGIAEKAGFAIEDNGVSVQLASPYLAGTAWDQIVSIIKAANVYATVDAVSGKIALWPKTGSRTISDVVISPENGMIGYPQFAAAQVQLRTEFGPKVAQLTRGPGQKIRVESQLTAAKGTFTVSTVGLTLSSQLPGGPWEMDITAYPPIYGQGGG